MLLLSITHSVTFYVVLTVVAAAIIAILARPSRRGEALSYLIPGVPELADPSVPETTPSLSILVNNDGTVSITRHAIKHMTSSAAITLAVTLIGHDLIIHQRLAGGYSSDPVCDHASFTIDFLGRDRYHIQYLDDDHNLMGAFSLNVRPGIKMTQMLKQ